MFRRGQPISIDRLPRTHKDLNGYYTGETDDGCPFAIYVHSGTRRANGHEIMQAQIKSMSRGRPMPSADLYKPHEEIYIIVGRRNRMDIRQNPNGTYFYGQVFGRTFDEVVVNLIAAYGPKPKAETADIPPPSSPKPF